MPTRTGCCGLAIGVFIGFTISQVGLVRHWIVNPMPAQGCQGDTERLRRDAVGRCRRVFFASKFAEGDGCC